MADTIAAPELERLPWLTDDSTSRRRAGRWGLIGLGIVVMVAVAAVSFWIGMNRTLAPPEILVEENRPDATMTVPLPEPEAMVQQVEPMPMQQVEPAPVPAPVIIRQQEEVRIAAPAERRAVRRPHRASRPKAAPAPAKSAADRKTLQFSNPWESAGASGRMVRVGTYSSLDQGKHAWSRLARVFPGMKKLPAVVTDIPSQRNGRVYYRLQIGTTSQAHSEVLCQRMRAIGQSCVVVDLAGARKGSWDERQPVGL
jgi:hypothetical protein